MVWEIARGRARSHLVGTAHFFPYHFRGSLERLIGAARSVVFEGPLDERAMRAVVDAGSAAMQASLYHALDAPARLRLCRQLGFPVLPQGVPLLYRELFFGDPDRWLEAELRGLRPWMAFFGLWTRFRRRQGGDYSLDLDAQRMASALGKEARYLETIEEQIGALDAIPLERIVDFIARANWPAYYADYVRRYLDGDLDALIAASRGFPSYCEAVIDRRDPELAVRMEPEIERGGACVFVGVAHCPGVLALLQRRGYEVILQTRLYD